MLFPIASSARNKQAELGFVSPKEGERLEFRGVIKAARSANRSNILIAQFVELKTEFRDVHCAIDGKEV